MNQAHLIIIGGGAAGFFSAINYKLRCPDKKVLILEKTGKVLAKVLVSGGGRCNVTHQCTNNALLVKNYPRGEKELLQVFSRFAVKDTISWFKKHGVELHAETDGRMFPVTNNSATVANCLLSLCHTLQIEIIKNCSVDEIVIENNRFTISSAQGVYQTDSVICSTGGHSKPEAYQFIEKLGHRIIAPIPSLFTINLPGEKIKLELQGTSVQEAEISIENSKLKYNGPVLITHWGLSGPAVLKLSAYAAQLFYEKKYHCNILLNWVPELKEVEAKRILQQTKIEKAKSLPAQTKPFNIPKRLWEYLLNKAGFDKTTNWANTNASQINKLCVLLMRDTYKMDGKTTFKEEFVTAGGVDLKEVDFKTMQSKLIKNLFFCGEVLNIDGITGGFNFQAAWSTAYIAASSV